MTVTLSRKGEGVDQVLLPRDRGLVGASGEGFSVRCLLEDLVEFNVGRGLESFS